MCNLAYEIAELESILADKTKNLTQDRIRKIQEHLEEDRYILGQWERMKQIPQDPQTRCLKAPFTLLDQDGTTVLHVFPAGASFWQDIWGWFSHNFGIDVEWKLETEAEECPA